MLLILPTSASGAQIWTSRVSLVPKFVQAAMGCSSSRESAVRADTGVMVTGIPKATRVEKGTIADELGDVPTYKQTLLLQKNQRSIEGRQSQVREYMCRWSLRSL